MKINSAHIGAALAAVCMMAFAATAAAEPGDAEAVAKARRDYAQAMKGHDVGVQNAMRAELKAQLALSRKHASRKGKPPESKVSS
jgi:hypothetical protein